MAIGSESTLVLSGGQKPEPGKKLNSRLEAEGAEFLVLGNILIENIECHKAYTNFPGYDLVALNTRAGKLARIQVKSRWATNRAGFFPIDNFDCDFVVHVALHRGIRQAKVTIAEGTKIPEYYVFPASTVQQHVSASGKINIREIPEYVSYRDAWHLIRAHLAL